jgi:outer membrane protein TolC
VKNAAKAQLENGVISANDYLREVNAEDQARSMLISHQIQLIQAEINYQIIIGK